jgi:hypothetical protein
MVDIMTHISERDFLIELQKGNISGHSMVHKFGRNAAVPMDDWEFVSRLGLTGWPLSAATTVRIKAGGNVADTAAGAGAREVTVQGIDDSFNEVSEDIATAGAGVSVATIASFWRVHRAWVSAVGTYGDANVGLVTIENSGGGTDLIQIAADKGQTQFAGWTVPISKTAYLLSIHMHVALNGQANFRVFTRDDIDDTVAPMKAKRQRLFFAVKGSLHYLPKGPEFAINAKSDFWIEVYGAGATASVACEFELLVVDDE